MAIPPRRVVVWVVVAFLAYSRLEAQSLRVPREAVDSLERAVNKQMIKVDQQFPAAELFEVSIHDVLPKQLSAGNVAIGAVESSYYIGSSEAFIQASDEPSPGVSEPNTILLKKNSKPEDCKKGYPGAGSQVCAQQPGGPEKAPPELRINALASLPIVLGKFPNLGIREDRPISIRLTTVSRLLQTVKPSRDNADVLHRLAAMNPSETIVTVAEADQVGSSALFKADNGEYLGKYFVHEALSPPARKPPE
jgi:hypothetical protein